MHDQLDAYLQLCRQIYERHIREGTWPWPEDSLNSEDMVDSDHSDDQT